MSLETFATVAIKRSYAAQAVAHGHYARLCVACDTAMSKSRCYMCKAPTVGRAEARELCGCRFCFPPHEPTRESIARAIMADLEARLGLVVYEYEVEAPQ